MLLGPDLARRRVMALCSKMDIGSRGGASANVLLMVSRQNWVRNWPMAGLETDSGRRASSRFRVRMAS